MCQLTFIDTKKPEIVPQSLLRLLLISNALEGHLDGFGFYLLDDHMIHKSVKTAMDWFDDKKNKKLWDSTENSNGIYHVRRASKLAKKVFPEHAHPFVEQGIVLAHNGTLTPKHFSKKEIAHLWKNDEDKIIDSQMFLRVLNFVRKGEILTHKHIQKALTYFTGSFAFLIHDLMNKNNIWVVRAETKTLYKLDIVINKRPVGMILNTNRYMLRLFMNIMLEFSPRSRGMKLTITEVPSKTIHNYELGTFELVKVADVEEKKTHTTTVVHKHVQETFLPEPSKPEKSTNVFQNIIDYMFLLGLTFNELHYMYESLAYDNIFTSTEQELLEFETMLENLIQFHNHTGRLEAWKGGCNKYFPNQSRIKVYLETKLKFPFMMNTKAEINAAFSEIKVEDGNVPIVH